jgi:glycosyltransferase involved in cell wall biosynthesis
VKILFVQKMAAISGSELYLMHLLPELKKRGYQVQVLIIFPTVPEKTKPFIDHFHQYGIITHEIYGHGALSPVLMRKLRKLLKKEQFDIVQSNLVHADLWLAFQKALFFRKMKLVSVKHGFDEPYSAKYGNDPGHLKKSLFYWVQKFSGWFANYNVTISKGLYNMYVKGKIVLPQKIRNIYYGLDLKDKEQLVVDRQPEEKYALILGRLVKYKGHELLMKAWKKVSAQNINWKLYIIGGGNYEQELVRLKEELQLGDTVKFCGYQANPHQFIKDSQFMLVTSKWEGFGLIMLESWAHKKPIIAFDVPAMNEAIEAGSNGLLVKPFDTDELAKKIIFYFQHPEIIEQHGVAGYLKLNSYYTVSRMADEMCEVYEQVCKSVK